MKTYLGILLIVVGLAQPALADHKKVKIHVKGMVCDFCKTGITKAFQSQPSVSKVDVNLTKKVVEVSYKHDAGELSDAVIEKLITEAGYNVAKIEK